MNKPRAEYRVGVGASSILMILVVLAMTALSLLSFSSAQKAEVMGKRNVAMVTAYYEAAAKVQEKLAVMDDAIATEAGRPKETDALGRTGVANETGSSTEKASQTELLAEAFAKRGLTDVTLSETEGTTTFAFSMDAGYQRMILVKGVIDLQGIPRCQVTNHGLVSLQMEDDFQGYSLLHANDEINGPMGDE